MIRWEKISAVILIAFGVFVTVYSRNILKIGITISPGAGFLPFLIGLSLIVLGALWLIKTLLDGTLRKRKSAEESTAAVLSEKPFAWKLIGGILVIILYAVLLERAGYFLSTLLFMAGWQKFVEKESWLKTGVITVLSTLAMYILFVSLLKVHLPAGAWFS